MNIMNEYNIIKFHFLNGITEINQLFDDILILWPAPVYMALEPFDNSSIDSLCHCIEQKFLQKSRFISVIPFKVKLVYYIHSLHTDWYISNVYFI